MKQLEELEERAEELDKQRTKSLSAIRLAEMSLNLIKLNCLWDCTKSTKAIKPRIDFITNLVTLSCMDGHSPPNSTV